MSQKIFDAPLLATVQRSRTYSPKFDPTRDSFGVTLDITNATVQVCCTNDPRAVDDPENAVWKVVDTKVASDSFLVTATAMQYWSFNVTVNTGSVQGWLNTEGGGELVPAN